MNPDDIAALCADTEALGPCLAQLHLKAVGAQVLLTERALKRFKALQEALGDLELVSLVGPEEVHLLVEEASLEASLRDGGPLLKLKFRASNQAVVWHIVRLAGMNGRGDDCRSSTTYKDAKECFGINSGFDWSRIQPDDFPRPLPQYVGTPVLATLTLYNYNDKLALSIARMRPAEES